MVKMRSNRLHGVSVLSQSSFLQKRRPLFLIKVRYSQKVTSFQDRTEEVKNLGETALQKLPLTQLTICGNILGVNVLSKPKTVLQYSFANKPLTLYHSFYQVRR